MGGRQLKRWIRYPLLDVGEIQSRHDAVEEVKDNPDIRRKIREELKSVYDLERLSSKIAMGHSNARDLVALKRSLNSLPGIWTSLSHLNAVLFQCNVDVDKLSTLARLIEISIREDAPPTINEGGIIKNGFNAELDELIKISRDGKGWLAELEAGEKKITGINALKVSYNKVFGYYIEIPKSRSEAVPGNYIRKQTLVNAERYITEELKNYESDVLSAEERRASLEYEIFNEIRGEIVKHSTSIQDVARFLAGLDCLVTLAEVAAQNDYHRPEINTEGHIFIEDGRHPGSDEPGNRFGMRFCYSQKAMPKRCVAGIVSTGLTPWAISLRRFAAL